MSRTPCKLNATDWALRGSVALVFILVGMEKLVGAGWVKLFAEIGLGQWFRHFAGMVQVTGSVLLVIPRTARFGTVLLACIMLGAIFVHLFVLGSGPSAALIPAVLLGLVVTAGWKQRGEPEDGKGFLMLQ